MMRFTFYHFNFNVLDLERSLKFYDEALGLKPVREKSAEDGSYKLIFLGDGVTGFQLELTWLRDHKEPFSESVDIHFSAVDVFSVQQHFTGDPFLFLQN